MGSVRTVRRRKRRQSLDLGRKVSLDQDLEKRRNLRRKDIAPNEETKVGKVEVLLEIHHFPALKIKRSLKDGQSQKKGKVTVHLRVEVEAEAEDLEVCLPEDVGQDQETDETDLVPEDHNHDQEEDGQDQETEDALDLILNHLKQDIGADRDQGQDPRREIKEDQGVNS